MIDKTKFAEDDFYLLEEILKRHSDLLEYTKNDHDVKTSFIITIPCPTAGNPPICIDRYGDGANVFFGPPHLDWYSLRRFVGVSLGDWFDDDNTLCVDAIDIVTEEIMSEELIATCWTGIIGGCGLLDLERYNKYLERKKNIVSVSWLGTYNRNYNGEWANPFPDD